MTLERRSRDKSSVDPDTGRWPSVVSKAVRISDLIAALEQVKRDEGDIEILGRKLYVDERDTWSDMGPVLDVSDLLDVVEGAYVSDSSDLFQDGKPVVRSPISGRFLMMDLG